MLKQAGKFLSIILILFSYSASGQNIGIGTTTPDHTLDINGSLGINDTLFHNNDTDSWMAFPSNDEWELVLAGEKFVKGTQTDKALIVNEGQSGVGFRIVGDGINDLMVINTDEDMIGIGTGDPDYLLDVGGSFRIIGDGINDLLVVNSEMNKIGIGTGNPDYLLDVGGSFRIIGDAINDLFVVDSEMDKVGIGTSTPEYLLDIQDGSLRVTGNNEEYLLFTDRVNNRIGIGTSTPQSDLDIQGRIETDELASDLIETQDLTTQNLNTETLTAQTVNADQIMVSNTNFQLSNLQGGQLEVPGDGIGDIITSTLEFPVPFNTVPKIVIGNVDQGSSLDDTYTVTVHTLTTSSCEIQVQEIGGGAWSGNIIVNWLAWE